MEFTTHFELHSQTTRLVERVYHKALMGCSMYGVLTLYDVLFQGTYPQVSTENTSLDYNADIAASFQI